MTEALFFSIILLLTSIYGLLGAFLNWESSKKAWRKGESFTVFDKILGVILFVLSIIFFVFVSLKGY